MPRRAPKTSRSRRRPTAPVPGRRPARRREIRLAGVPLQPPRHVLAFFRDQEEEFKILVPFIKQGLQQRDKAFYILDDGERDAYLDRLGRAGIDVERLQRSGQLEVATWGESHFPEGRFSPDETMAFIRNAVDRSRSQGYRLTRLIAHMEWALREMPGVHNLVQFEALFGEAFRGYDDPFICAYDANKFGGGVIIDGMRTHPVVVVGGVLHQNPFYTPPAEFLKELLSRKG